MARFGSRGPDTFVLYQRNRVIKIVDGSRGGNRPRENCRSVQNTETLAPQSADSATASPRK
jgi:hypothetical protein